MAAAAGKDLSRQGPNPPYSPPNPLSRLGMIIVGSQILCEVSKQVCYYSLSYFNDGAYPVPRTAVVCSVELLKLFFTCLRLGCESVSDFSSTHEIF